MTEPENLHPEEDLAEMVAAQTSQVRSLREDLSNTYPTKVELKATEDRVEQRRRRTAAMFFSALAAIAAALLVVGYGVWTLRDLPQLSRENHDALSILKNATSPETQAAQAKATADAVTVIDCDFRADLDKAVRDLFSSAGRPVPEPKPLGQKCTDLGVSAIP